MRVLLTSVGSRGDVEPVVGLAVAVRDLGADVQVCAPPDEDFVKLLARAGVPLVPLGPSVRSVVAREKPPTPEDAFRFAAELVAARFDTLGTAAEGCDALLAAGLMPAGARDVAEKLGIPYVFACYQTYGHFPQDETAWEQGAERANAMYREPLNSHRAALGLPPVDDVRAHVFTDKPWLAAEPALCPPPEVEDLVQTGAWILPDDRPLPAELEAFLDRGEPPVYVGFGSMGAYVPKDIAQVAIEAVRAHGRRVLLARGWAGLTSIDDADDCFVVGEVNQQSLFTRVAAVVHHGGAGTTTTTARAGAPQVIVPQIADQPHFAAKVAELGIGAAHDGSTPTVDSLSAALQVALAPETRARANAVAGSIRTDGAPVAAKLLLDTASR
ncbi:glycosyltransferase [Allokutzneria albata]|uniref:UDP:flavonoid glycosyltransferase YjiC, YdhE family n=1 Tax=Allokutzneria albata TaxID=211114 RepID=A0A1G9S540_ALLAB|nr:glycosyltransferase [Allokutzneria albata]SDM30623.1 UDP:flavonoid glycosyltransferase YjiC, YdhE family [Allokutzneria albata]